MDCPQKDAMFLSKRKKGLFEKNEPSRASLHPARSGPLLGFEVSPPCTFQSHSLHFITLANILKCIFKEHFIAYSTLFIFQVCSNILFIACLLRHFTILLQWNVYIMRIMEDILPRSQINQESATRQTAKSYNVHVAQSMHPFQEKRIIGKETKQISRRILITSKDCQPECTLQVGQDGIGLLSSQSLFLS